MQPPLHQRGRYRTPTAPPPAPSAAGPRPVASRTRTGRTNATDDTAEMPIYREMEAAWFRDSRLVADGRHRPAVTAGWSAAVAGGHRDGGAAARSRRRRRAPPAPDRRRRRGLAHGGRRRLAGRP